MLPQEHDVTLSGPKIGTFEPPPPRLLGPRQFLRGGMNRPSAVEGGNETPIASAPPNVPGAGDLDLDGSRFGPAVQACLDLEIATRVFLDVAVKKIRISSDVMLNSRGATVRQRAVRAPTPSRGARLL